MQFHVFYTHMSCHLAQVLAQGQDTSHYHHSEAFKENKSSLQEVCNFKDIWDTAGFLEDNTTTVVGDTKETPRFLRLSAVGFAPHSVRQRCLEPRFVLIQTVHCQVAQRLQDNVRWEIFDHIRGTAGISSQGTPESAGHGSGDTIVVSAGPSAASQQSDAGADQGARASSRSRAVNLGRGKNRPPQGVHHVTPGMRTNNSKMSYGKRNRRQNNG